MILRNKKCLPGQSPQIERSNPLETNKPIKKGTYKVSQVSTHFFNVRVCCAEVTKCFRLVTGITAVPL